MPRPVRGRARGHGRCLDEAHRRRLLGLLPRARLAGELLPRRGSDETGRTWRVLLDLGQRRARRAAPVRRPARGRRACSSATCTPTTASTCAATTCCANYHPDGAQPLIPVWGPPGTAERMAAAYGLPADPGMTEEFDFRELRRARRGRPVHGRGGAGRAPRAGLRLPGDAPAAAPSPTPATPGPAPALDELAAGADLLLAEASFRSGDDNPPDLHLTGADCGERRREAAVGPAGADPRAAVVRPGDGGGRGEGAVLGGYRHRFGRSRLRRLDVYRPDGL